MTAPDQGQSLLEALKGACMWLRLLCDEADLDPDECVVRFTANSSAGRKEVAAISLTQALERYDAAIAKAEAPQ